MASFWSNWIIILTTITIVGITWILLGNRKREQQSTEKTTGHVYDGIEELDNPLPAWWFYMCLITIVWGVGYLIVYPGMGNWAGVLGWSSVGQYEKEVAAADAQYRDMRDRYLALSVEEIATIWHIPGKVLLNPNVSRVESTKREAPSNLPTGTPEHLPS